MYASRSTRDRSNATAATIARAARSWHGQVSFDEIVNLTDKYGVFLVLKKKRGVYNVPS